MTDLTQIEESAALWLLRSEDPEWSAADQVQLDQWLAEADLHKAAFWRLRHGWREADRIASTGVRPSPATWRRRPSDQWIKIFAAAASLLLVFGMFGVQVSDLVFGPPSNAFTTEFSTKVGGHKVVSLPDGSRVELNTDTKVVASLDQDNRQVWLKSGEAFFDVAKNGRPFVVHAGPRTITVLGTKFSVRRDGPKVTVSVQEGRVRVQDQATNAAVRSTIISAGDIAIAAGPATLVAANAPDRVQEHLAWRNGMLFFDGTTLADAAYEFNRYNEKQIVIRDPEIAQTRIGGSFQAKNVDSFVRLLEEAYHLKVAAGPEKISISS